MPPKPKRGDSEYVPGEEEEEEEEEEFVEEPSTKTTKKEETGETKSKKKTRRRKKDDEEEFRPSDEDTDSEEYSDTEASSSKKKQKSPSPGGDDKKKTDDKKEEVSAPIKKSRKKGDQITVTDDKFDIESDEANKIDKLLASLPLPSDSRRPVFNQHISKIGSFNIQAFGIKKSSHGAIMKIIADILRNYGIILCQEIRANEDIIQKLTELVSTPATPYSYVLSRPIGRTTYQERYVYLYRKNEWKVLEDYVIDDDEKLGDKFIREPYVARFQHLKKSNVRITLVGCHTQPEKAFDEIESLVTLAYRDVKKKLQRDIVQEKRQLDRGIPKKEKKENDSFLSCWPCRRPKKRNNFITTFLRYFCCCCPESYDPVTTRDISEELPTDEPIVMMGDFNAAGSYVNKTKRSELDAILKEHDLMWGIQHNIDTTVADGPDTAYDRFIFETANERKWIGNVGVWRFDDGWIKGATDVTSIKKAAKRVSDHYPIEFELKLK